jgi:methionyl-tRNA formyltransferase
MLRIGFAGTPAFAAAALTAILDAGYPVRLVLTQPERPQGRGLKVLPCPVKALAEHRGLPVRQPATLKTDEARAPVIAIALDVLVVAAYGLILPPAILSWPRYGCLNIHASLLPRWRGAAPIQRALLAGDRETGITIMQMDAGLDTGPMVDAVRVAISPRDTTGTLQSRLATVGGEAIVATLARLASAGSLAATPQPVAGGTYASKVRRDEAAIDWTSSATELDRQIRAFDPAPGAFTALDGDLVKVWRAEPVAEHQASAVPGTVLGADSTAIVVACGAGALRILELQPAGGKRLPAAAYAAGRRLARGRRFETPRHERS